MEMSVSLSQKGDEEYFSTNSDGNRVEIDMLPHGRKKAQSPMELLLSGVVACAAVDIVSMIKKRRKTLTHFEGKASGNRRDEYPRKFTDITISYRLTSPDLKDEEAEKIIALAVEKYCSVAGSLSETTVLKHDFEIVRPDE